MFQIMLLRKENYYFLLISSELQEFLETNDKSMLCWKINGILMKYRMNVHHNTVSVTNNITSLG